MFVLPWLKVIYADEPQVYYEVSDDELLEDNCLLIPGETPLEDSGTISSSSSETETDVPIRLLQDFSIYNLNTNQLVFVGELLSLPDSTKQQFGASGLVNAWTVVDDDEEDYFSDTASVSTGRLGERVKLSSILEFSIHDFSESLDTYELHFYLQSLY